MLEARSLSHKSWQLPRPLFALPTAHFVHPGVGFNAQSGATYDGTNKAAAWPWLRRRCSPTVVLPPPAGFALDDASGKLTGSAWNWTSPAKESVHISLLALAINDTITQECAASRACRLVGSKQAAIDVLERKLTSMEGFNKRFPGYGGFLPWVLVGDNGLVPALDWLHSVPGLDNGINTHSLSLSLVRTAQPHVLGHLAWRGQVKWCGAWWRPHVPW